MTGRWSLGKRHARIEEHSRGVEDAQTRLLRGVEVRRHYLGDDRRPGFRQVFAARCSVRLIMDDPSDGWLHCVRLSLTLIPPRQRLGFRFAIVSRLDSAIRHLMAAGR